MQAAAKSAPVLFLFPHAELNHFSIQSGSHRYVLQYQIIWSLKKKFVSVAMTVSESAFIHLRKLLHW